MCASRVSGLLLLVFSQLANKQPTTRNKKTALTRAKQPFARAGN